MLWIKRALLGATVLLVLFGGFIAYNLFFRGLDPYLPMFADHCADCHGGDLRGTEKGSDLLKERFRWGNDLAAIINAIQHQHDDANNFQGILDEEEIKGLALFVGERRLGQTFLEFRTSTPILVPGEAIESEVHPFRLEVVAKDLDPMVFGIAPLPDGGVLLTEKEKGLSIISPDGSRSAYITGTPVTGNLSFDYRGLDAGVGWLLDVALHPDYINNGWIYLHYTELCESDCPSVALDSSMNRLDRGRIRDGEWVDVETIWRADKAFYTTFTDTAAGGRIAFDGNGHVFISVGFKQPLGLGAQDLDQPYGKIHRIMDDGSVPPDNPFVVNSGNSAEVPFTRQTIWTYGHRTPQGLEWNPARGAAWNAEMGPRGGDEINELIPGRNYGWPYQSLGLEYTGREVKRYELDKIEFDQSQVVQTLVDFTPSPAISSFAFYHGDAFPGWRGNLLQGTLKGASLYRLVFDGTALQHMELLFNDLGRIRDIEVGFDGFVYLLVENRNGSMILRMVPAV